MSRFDTGGEPTAPPDTVPTEEGDTPAEGATSEQTSHAAERSQAEGSAEEEDTPTSATG